MWLATAFQAGVVYWSFRSGDYLFAAHAVTLACTFALLAWKGEPARGTGQARMMWGLLGLSGIFIGAAFVSTSG
jgi:hypothetical protein